MPDDILAFIDVCDNVLSFDILGSLLIAVLIGAVISLIIVFSMKSKLKSVRPQKTASNYVRSGSFTLTRDLDLYLYRTIVRTRRADTNSGSRGGGGGSRGGGRGGDGAGSGPGNGLFPRRAGSAGEPPGCDLPPEKEIRRQHR